MEAALRNLRPLRRGAPVGHTSDKRAVFLDPEFILAIFEPLMRAADAGADAPALAAELAARLADAEVNGAAVESGQSALASEIKRLANQASNAEVNGASVETGQSALAAEIKRIADQVADAEANGAAIEAGQSALAAELKRVADQVSGIFGDAVVDAFGRIRTSGTGQRLDVEFIYDKRPAFMDEVTNDGTVTFNAASRDLTLSLANATAGSSALMRSHPVPYTPGNSQLIDITGVLDFAGIGGGTAQVFLRSNVTGTVVETVVDQADWSEDTVPDIDWSKSQIFSMDFQSLKVGRVRYFLVGDGKFTLLHTLDNDNRTAAGFWQLPSLPVYWRIYNDATNTYMEIGYGDESNAIGFRYQIAANAAATMKAICCTVKSEGGDSLRDLGGVPFSANMGETAKAISTTRLPLLSIRSAATFNALPNLGILMPKAFSVSIDNPVRIDLILNGTLTGASFGQFSARSTAEVDTTATAVTGGEILLSEYVATSKNTDSAGQGFLGREVLWNRLGAETGTLTIAAVRTSATDADCLASILWEEIR